MYIYLYRFVRTRQAGSFLMGINVRTCFYRQIAFAGTPGTRGLGDRRISRVRMCVYVCMYICMCVRKRVTKMCEMDARRRGGKWYRLHSFSRTGGHRVHGGSRDGGSNRGSANWFGCVSHLRPRSFFKVPPYLFRVPIRSIISGIQLANMAYTT